MTVKCETQAAELVERAGYLVLRLAANFGVRVFQVRAEVLDSIIDAVRLLEAIALGDGFERVPEGAGFADDDERFTPNGVTVWG